MRRLTEILIFPRAWYRRSLVRRLFLGELKTTSFHREENMETSAVMASMSLKKTSTSAPPPPAVAPVSGIIPLVTSIKSLWKWGHFEKAKPVLKRLPVF